MGKGKQVKKGIPGWIIDTKDLDKMSMETISTEDSTYIEQ